ncbi:MAG: electron transport complex subunit RsxC [Gammaproteobacteria bacterium]|nr:electron transport complex subunit RsxC [Gammaproteobacteria bacterium]
MMRRLYNFAGGVRLKEHKRESTSSPVGRTQLPQKIILPLHQHIGVPAKPIVNAGERVLKGQVVAEAGNNISAPIHASTSGTVLAIEDHPIAHPSGLPARCIIIKTDGKDEAAGGYGAPCDTSALTQEQLNAAIKQAGIVGLGGAGFPTYLKLANEAKKITTLILNGVECEPYITCDQMLMRGHSADIVRGLVIMQRALGIKRAIIAIENNKPKELELMQEAIYEAGTPDMELVQVPTVYPAGGEKQLIQTLTGKEVPSQGLPMDIGIVCHNVGTTYAIYRAIAFNEPLISRYITIAGSVAKAQVLDVLIGTPVSHLIEQCGGNRKTLSRVIMGGPMMGFALHDDEAPVVKTTNCILVNSVISDVPLPSRSNFSLPCIRCGACADACPVGLLPQQLYWYARARDFDKVQDYNLFDCIECGCCDYVCPSQIPLVQYYRYAKTAIWQQENEKTLSDISRQRHEFHKFRQEREKQERELRHKQKRQAVDGASTQDNKKAAIQAAMERVRRKREHSDVTPKNIDNLTEQQQKLIEEADARRKKKLEELKPEKITINTSGRESE